MAGLQQKTGQQGDTALRAAKALALLLLLCTVATAKAEPRRVLFLHSFGPNFSPYRHYIPKLRAELRRHSSDPIDEYEASLATARFAQGERDAPFVEYLESLFAGRRLDLAITIGAPAADFLQRHRQRLFSSTPVLLTAVDQRFLRSTIKTENDAAVAVRINLPMLIENIVTVRPQTKRIHVVTGTSPLERFWLAEMQREFPQPGRGLSFDWLNELSLGQMLRRLAALPPDSAIFFGHLSVDAAGIPHEEDKALAAIHAVANAPIFSYLDAYLGRGIVGGPMISTDEMGRAGAAAAIRILRGERPQNASTPAIGFATPAYDWRELRRWQIDESSLPPGSIVHFRSPTTWDRFKWYIVAASAFVALQAALIGVLLVSRHRLRRANTERRRAEEAAQELNGRLITAQEEERSRLARELHDDLTQRLAILAIDAGREERKVSGSPEAIRSIREGLVRLSEDVHALSYRLHPAILDDLGLVEALRSECEHFAQTCAASVETSTQEIPERLPHDVALCLFRIAQEALRNIARHAEATRVEVRLRSLDGGLQLMVSDNGRGFDPERDRTTASLGHASMRQRAHILGGNVDIRTRPGFGTEVVAWVPLQEDYSEPRARAVG
jgi:signal transduction histidine kinase